jgi:hypothetical protein
MIKKQVRNNLVSCLVSELINDFPPYTLGGFPVREHSICEVMDNVSKIVVAVYKLHAGQWYRYDLISVFPPYPPQPQPLNESISRGLVVPNIPLVLEPTTLIVSVSPTATNKLITVPTVPTITDSTS